MPNLLVRHKVEDYAVWKPGYDAHGAARKAAGCQGTTVFRSADDPNTVVVLLEWNTLENARQFAQSDELRETMQRLGVIDQPDIYFLNEDSRTTA
jgi:heme-degrading monooxygenase HmoA